MSFNIEFNALVLNTCHVVLCERKLLNSGICKLGRKHSAFSDLAPAIVSTQNMFVSVGRNNVPASVSEHRRHLHKKTWLGLMSRSQIHSPPLAPMTETLFPCENQEHWIGVS